MCSRTYHKWGSRRGKGEEMGSRKKRDRGRGRGRRRKEESGGRRKSKGESEGGEGRERKGESEGGEQAGPLPTPIYSSICHIKTYLAMFVDVLVLCLMSVQEVMFLTSTVGIAAVGNPV